MVPLSCKLHHCLVSTALRQRERAAVVTSGRERTEIQQWCFKTASAWTLRLTSGPMDVRPKLPKLIQNAGKDAHEIKKPKGTRRQTKAHCRQWKVHKDSPNHCSKPTKPELAEPNLRSIRWGLANDLWMMLPGCKFMFLFESASRSCLQHQISCWTGKVKVRAATQHEPQKSQQSWKNCKAPCRETKNPENGKPRKTCINLCLSSKVIPRIWTPVISHLFLPGPPEVLPYTSPMLCKGRSTHHKEIIGDCYEADKFNNTTHLAPLLHPLAMLC